VHDLKINNLKVNGHCVSVKGNGLITNGHIKNGHLVKNGYEKIGQCLLVNGNGHLVKNGNCKLTGDGMTKNGMRKNEYSGVTRRCRKDSQSGKGGSTVTEETSSIEDEQCSEKTMSDSKVPHASETDQTSHIKVSFYTLLDIHALMLHS